MLQPQISQPYKITTIFFNGKKLHYIKRNITHCLKRHDGLTSAKAQKNLLREQAVALLVAPQVCLLKEPPPHDKKSLLSL